MEDNWKQRSSGMICKTCMYFVNFRCRRRAPTMKGYPAVYETDWCGDHKLSKEYMDNNTIRPIAAKQSP